MAGHSTAIAMDWILEVGDDDHGKCNGNDYVGPGNKDTWYQFIISVSLGISAFLSFCVSGYIPELIKVS